MAADINTLLADLLSDSDEDIEAEASDQAAATLDPGAVIPIQPAQPPVNSQATTPAALDSRPTSSDAGNNLSAAADTHAGHADTSSLEDDALQDGASPVSDAAAPNKGPQGELVRPWSDPAAIDQLTSGPSAGRPC